MLIPFKYPSPQVTSSSWSYPTSTWKHSKHREQGQMIRGHDETLCPKLGNLVQKGDRYMRGEKEIWCPVMSSWLLIKWGPFPGRVRPINLWALTPSTLIHTQGEFFWAPKSMKNKWPMVHQHTDFFFFKCFNCFYLLGYSWKRPWHFWKLFTQHNLKPKIVFQWKIALHKNEDWTLIKDSPFWKIFT